MDACYEFLLDLYPILMSFPAEAALLVMRIEQIGYECLEGQDKFSNLLTLLSMAKDLGYIDERLYFFLERRAGML